MRSGGKRMRKKRRSELTVVRVLVISIIFIRLAPATPALIPSATITYMPTNSIAMHVILSKRIFAQREHMIFN